MFYEYCRVCIDMPVQRSMFSLNVVCFRSMFAAWACSKPNKIAILDCHINPDQWLICSRVYAWIIFVACFCMYTYYILYIYSVLVYIQNGRNINTSSIISCCLQTITQYPFLKCFEQFPTPTPIGTTQPHHLLTSNPKKSTPQPTTTRTKTWSAWHGSSNLMIQWPPDWRS